MSDDTPIEPRPRPPLTVDERPLARRVTRLTLGAVTLALLLAGALINGAAFLLDRDALAQDAAEQARVIANSVSAALVFDDAPAAAETLGTLRDSPRIAQARLYTADGRLFARHRRTDQAKTEAEPEPALGGPAGGVAIGAVVGAAAAAADAASARAGEAPVAWSFGGGQLWVVAPVRHEGRHLGELQVRVPLQPLYEQALLFGGVTLGAIAVALLLGWGAALGLRRDVGRIEQNLRQLAHIDPVTGLYNRHAATQHLVAYTAAARADPHGGYSIVTLDLDDFKTINDTLGHHVGDEVLREVARRLRAALQPGARAYRFGGDEFVVICPCPAGLREPTRYAELVRRVLGDTLRVAGVEVQLGGSIGVARFPHDGDDAEAVLLASDIAMYESKRLGKHQTTVFDGRLREGAQQRLRLESELRQALRDGQLRLVYQPVLSRDGRITGAEALVRWRHPQRGEIPPGQFIDVAESSGQIVQLGGWVLAEAARQLVRWRACGLPPLRLAVNVSARQLRGGMLLTQFRQALAETGCNPACLEIELTEHSLVEDVDDNLQQLHALRALGARIAIDDFGTGQSALAYMKRLPVDKLKIDQSFVAGLPDDRGDLAIVTAALSMAHALGLQVVAEGVETEAQHALLRKLGVDLLQGYLLGRPMSADDLAARLRAEQASAPAPAQPAEAELAGA